MNLSCILGGVAALVIGPSSLGLEHPYNQTIFQDAVVYEHDRSAVVVHVSVDANTSWETMPMPPDCEHVHIAGVVASSPHAGTVMMPDLPHFERVPGSSVTAGATDAGWETMSIPPDCAHISGAGNADGAPGSDQEAIPIPSDCEGTRVWYRQSRW